MDDFVRNKLKEWGLSQLIETFQDQEIDEESFYTLDDKEIDNLIPKAGPRMKFKKKFKLLQVFPSTSSTSDEVKGKRKFDHQHESSNWQIPGKRQRDSSLESYTEKVILSRVKEVMSHVYKRLPNQDNSKLNAFLRDKICDLETDKRELVGVFGKTGAGKSSLINAVIGEKDLLPSGSVTACTSVMIKVEANRAEHNPKYEAEIEFITKEEWEDELCFLLNFLGDNADQEKDQEDEDDYRDTVEKLSALYGEEWENKSSKNLMENKYFKEIPEFLHSRKKILTCESAKELSARFVKYTRSGSQDGENKGVKRWYWPLVKCVTVRVPNNDLLQHVTLVDLPGNGDCDKSRDKMWKGVVGSCSTVWIVTDINRAASEKEPWEILRNACSRIGNGGECQNIHFICTKSDIEDFDGSAAGVRVKIFKRNEQAKQQVSKEFSKQIKVKKHFSDDSFKVFTVSSKEFLKRKHLNPEETEIPDLQEFLQTLNDCHSETLNYAEGARGILSLMKGARCRGVAGEKTDVCTLLEENMRRELDEVRKPMEETCQAFEKHLTDGVEKSTKECERVLKSKLHPSKMKARGFHKVLQCAVENNGINTRKKGKEINLNVALASCLTDSIDEEFKKTFPNERTLEPFNGVIRRFSLDTEKLIQKYKDFELQLIFLKTEEDKTKTELNKIIREKKKIIYSSLTKTVEETMQPCYKKAATFRGTGMLQNMRDTIKSHVRDSKNIMFAQAKDVMLNHLRGLKEDILKRLEETMQKSIDLSLKTDSDSIPDVTTELGMVEEYYNELLEQMILSSSE